MYNGF